MRITVWLVTRDRASWIVAGEVVLLTLLLSTGSPALRVWLGLPLLAHLGYRALTSLPIGQVPGRPAGVARRPRQSRGCAAEGMTEPVVGTKQVEIAFGLDGRPRTTTVEHDEVGAIPISASGRWEDGGGLVLTVVTGWAVPQTWTINFTGENAVSLEIASVFYDTTVSGRAAGEQPAGATGGKGDADDESSEDRLS